MDRNGGLGVGDSVFDSTSEWARRDYGHLGCVTDVRAEVDAMCSGRLGGCRFAVSRLNPRQPCPADLTPYLQVDVRAETLPRCSTHAYHSRRRKFRCRRTARVEQFTGCHKTDHRATDGSGNI